MTAVIPENIRAVISGLEDCGYEAFIVGGCVRDMLMGSRPHDYDIATNARPEQVRGCFDSLKVIDTGIKHGTVTVVSGGENVEVTTYRMDGAYKDHRRPESISFSDSLSEDLRRRDFTINSMAYSDRTGIVDIFGGRDDLREHTIRCVGSPRLRFEEDALRMLRALRFASLFGFDIDEEAAAAVHDMRYLLDAVSRERVCSELEKMLCGADIRRVMLEFPDVFDRVIPELSGVMSRGEWELTAERISLSENDCLLRLALLLCEADAPAGDILKRLKTDRNTFRTADILAARHGEEPCTDMPSARRLMRDIGSENSLLLAEMLKSIAAADGDAGGVSDSVKMRGLIERAVSEKLCFSQQALAFSGTDAEEMGFSGKAVGRLLEYLLTGVIEERFPNTHDALRRAASGFK